MRTPIAPGLLAAVLLAGTAAGATTTPPDRAHGDAPYRVASLRSLGGTSSAGTSVSDRGWVAGFSNLRGDRRRHASLWRNRRVTDLGTLGGPNSAVLWPVKNVRGLVTGIAQTSRPDPLQETWSCGFFFPTATGTGHQCLGFRWRDGVMTPLPTLGGTNGFATGSNNHGQIVGWAESRVHDPTCVAPQVLQFRAVVWGHRRIRQLRPLPGDSVSAATAINDHGQIVGISGVCDQAAGRFSAIHDVMWRNGRPTDIGDLGGVAWNTPMALNQHGDAVGFANASAADGGSFDPRAVMWIRGRRIRKLGTLPGDVTSQALGINKLRQVVGQSCNADGACRAFLWHDGVMTDLNRLVGAGHHDLLTTANDIDDSGRITGQAVDGEGRIVAFLAIPTRRDEAP